MKKLTICVLLAIMLCPALNARAEADIYLQVIGATDLQADQEYKLLVRDWALELAAEGAGNRLESELNLRALEAGRVANIHVQWGKFPLYGQLRQACRVTIGQGCGRNWFGLLYPETALPGEDVIYYSALINWLADIFNLF